MVGIAFLATVFLASLVSADPCYQGWEYNNGSCYGLSDAQVSWAEAAKVCQLFNGYLAEIESEEENEFVKEYLASKGAEKIWIGGTDIFNEGTFEWLSEGGRPLNFTDWHHGQPTDDGHSQDCIDIRENYQYQWGDDSCVENYNFICEIPPLEEPIEE